MEWMDQFVDAGDLVEVVFPDDDYPHTSLHETVSPNYGRWLSDTDDLCDSVLIHSLGAEEFRQL